MRQRGRHIYSIWRSLLLALVLIVAAAGSLMAQYDKEYFLWMSRKMMINERYRDAITLLNTLIRVDEKSYDAYLLRGIAKYNMSDLIGADSDMSLAIEYNPVYTAAYNYRAIIRSRLGNYDDALNDFAEAIDLRPDLPDPYYSRGVTRLLNQQFEAAIDDFDRFIIQEQRVADAYINRGICYLNLSDTLSAYRDFDIAIKTNRNSPDGYNRRGTLRLQQDKFTSAKDDFDRAISNDSTHISSYFNRALAYNNLHKPNEALEDLDRVIALDSTSSITYFNRAIMLSQVGDYNLALEDYDQVAHLSPDNVLVYFYRANLLSRLGEIERAEYDYTRAIELYPDFANAYLSRANIRSLLRNSKGALEDKAIAERKIAEHKSKLRDSSYSIYSDTTYRFDKLLSFDTKLSGSSFDKRSNQLTSQHGDLQLIGQYKFTLIEPDSTTIEHHEYYDLRLERMLDSLGDRRLTIDHRQSGISADSLSAIAKRYNSVSNDKDWAVEFERGIAQGLIKQYTTAIESLSRAIELAPENPFLYINRAATRTEMIEFISSIESSFHRIAIDSDPAKRLNTPNVTREYDHSEALADLDRAIELHPTLAYAHYNRAGILMVSGRLPEAYEAYNEAIRLYPNFAAAYYNRGIVQITMKDTRKGCIDLSKAGELGIDRAYEMLKKYSSEL